MSETETVIKRIIPYLQRRGYDVETDLRFEDPVEIDTENRKGFIDILVTCGKRNPYFVIEAKRDGTKLQAKHRKQAIEYGESKKCLFVALTNGQTFEMINVNSKKPIKLNGTAFNRLPSKEELTKIVIPSLKKNPKEENIYIPNDKSIPFRPGIPLTKLNRLIQQCHNTIRKIEKNEEYAFSDFSKILFLKLLEEKWDAEGVNPPYTYLFHELAQTPKDRADQVQVAIRSMISTITNNTRYGEVLADPIRLRKDLTYLSIVKAVSSISWSDCNLDSKGAAFEYFVRASLKGKKLGQYFTPRPLVKLMLRLGRYNQILSSLKAGVDFKVLDPACGTGGFLVYAMNLCFEDLNDEFKKNLIHKNVYEKVTKKLREETFYGIDAHEGVASTAKMNMIIAGDGHNNIRNEDTLKLNKLIPDYYQVDMGTNQQILNTSGKAQLILSNPPFGTSEGESLTPEEKKRYPLPSTKGQSLFIQKMISSVDSGSRIVTVIDEGVLNTASYAALREHILKECRIEYVISVPDETFKPNKINVKTSVLVLKKRDENDVDEFLEDEYPILFLKINSLGYDGSGEEIRGFDLEKIITEIETLNPYNFAEDERLSGYNWEGNIVYSNNIKDDRTRRIDYKFWNIATREKLNKVKATKGWKTLKEINVVPTQRGSSPSASEYVSKEEGHALVIKAGSNISKLGKLIIDGDYVEEPVYREYVDKEKMVVLDGDILLASTGDGTLGKCCVYRNYDESKESRPAIPDGHVTVIRVDQQKIYPEFLCDYLRKGFGSEQIYRLFTGATGLIELQPDDVNEVIVPGFPSLKEQKKLSGDLRAIEEQTQITIESAMTKLGNGEQAFYNSTI
ncbi:N-6 DNA methylase [Bacillus altitudinis]|uniref:N-6 DNA methylase n=1 Tax=Bacillus altitudinis TaxID=293387 RepID=UPI001C3F068E|nr:N-6 DNA methylase [Bacillus altitudinis]QXJ48143.1 N-6 DNA methylase [Bacillus altitudinis]